MEEHEETTTETGGLCRATEWDVEGRDGDVANYDKLYANMYACKYVCMYVRMYMCMHMYTHLNVCICIYVCIYVCMYGSKMVSVGEATLIPACKEIFVQKLVLLYRCFSNVFFLTSEM